MSPGSATRSVPSIVSVAVAGSIVPGGSTWANSPPTIAMSAGRVPAGDARVTLRMSRSTATMASVNDARRPHAVLGFYGPDSIMWRINREAVLLGAGPAALLLQVAHPLVAEGVAQHSRVAD